MPRPERASTRPLTRCGFFHALQKAPPGTMARRGKGTDRQFLRGLLALLQQVQEVKNVHAVGVCGGFTCEMQGYFCPVLGYF